MLPRLLLMLAGLVLVAPVASAGPVLHTERVNLIVACLDPNQGIILGVAFPPDIPDACNPDPCWLIPYRAPGIPSCVEIETYSNP